MSTSSKETAGWQFNKAVPITILLALAIEAITFTRAFTLLQADVVELNKEMVELRTEIVNYRTQISNSNIKTAKMETQLAYLIKQMDSLVKRK